MLRCAHSPSPSSEQALAQAASRPLTQDSNVTPLTHKRPPPTTPHHSTSTPISTSTLVLLRSVCHSHFGTDSVFVQKRVKGRFAASREGLAPCHPLSRSVSPLGTASWHRDGTGTQFWPMAAAMRVNKVSPVNQKAYAIHERIL